MQQKALIDKDVLLLIKSPPVDATMTVQGAPTLPPPQAFPSGINQKRVH